MHRRKLAAFGITLAIASIAPLAANAQAMGARPDDRSTVDFSPLPPPSATSGSIAAPVTVDREVELAPPIAVEREVEVAPPVAIERDVIVEPALAAPRAAYARPANPESGQLIDHGLFNRRGPNDFGS